MLTESPQPNVGMEGVFAGLHWRSWLLVPVIGIGAGLLAGLLMKLLRATQHLAWPAAGGNFLHWVQAASPAHRIGVLVAAGVIAGVTRLLLRQATGGHAGELAEAIWFHAGRLPFLRTLARAVVSIIVVGLGASLGREAAPKQAGAGLAALLAEWMNVPPGHRRLLAACGAGAGIAAIYNVPFGGALFALEVLLGTLALPLIPPALIASSLATATAWLLLPMRPTYDVPFYPVSASLVVWAVLVGPLAGLASVVYVRLVCWADARRPGGLGLVMVPLIVFAALGALAIPLPQLLGNGKDVVQLAFSGRLTAPLLLLLIVLLKPAATAACVGCGAPGGLFTPTLTLGAALGALAGQLWGLVWPGAPAGAFAVVGAAAVLAASTQGPVSAIVLTAELTWRIDTLMGPVMLAIAGAVFTARLLEVRSIYSGRIHQGRGAARPRADAVSAAARYGEMLQALLAREQDGKRLLVVDEKGAVLGAVCAARARSPLPENHPLETATAGDFVEGIRR